MIERSFLAWEKRFLVAGIEAAQADAEEAWSPEFRKSFRWPSNLLGGYIAMPTTPSSHRRSRFFARVYALVRRIPRGRVTSYGSIARALGVPRGARTVGWALRTCPDDAPWHRVINAQGKISLRPTGGYLRQRMLLRKEGVRFTRDGRIDLEKFGWKAL